MWTTRDGYRLRLTHGGLHRILARTAPGRLKPLARFQLEGDPAGSVVRSIARITRTVHLAERGPTEQGLALFRGPRFELLVRSTGPRRADILQVRPRSEEEVYPATDPRSRQGGRRVRGSRVHITWRKGSLGWAARIGDGGVYVVVRRTSPLIVYVGETSRFSRRFRERIDALRHLGMTTTPACSCLRNLDVWLGTVRETTKSGAHPADIRRDLEHVLVREYGRAMRANPGTYRLINRNPKAEIVAAPAGVEVTSTSRRPPGIRDSIRLTGGRTLEIRRV